MYFLALAWPSGCRAPCPPDTCLSLSISRRSFRSFNMIDFPGVTARLSGSVLVHFAMLRLYGFSLRIFPL